MGLAPRSGEVEDPGRGGLVEGAVAHEVEHVPRTLGKTGVEAGGIRVLQIVRLDPRVILQGLIEQPALPPDVQGRTQRIVRIGHHHQNAERRRDFQRSNAGRDLEVPHHRQPAVEAQEPLLVRQIEELPGQGVETGQLRISEIEAQLDPQAVLAVLERSVALVEQAADGRRKEGAEESGPHVLRTPQARCLVGGLEVPQEGRSAARGDPAQPARRGQKLLQLGLQDEGSRDLSARRRVEHVHRKAPVPRALDADHEVPDVQSSSVLRHPVSQETRCFGSGPPEGYHSLLSRAPCHPPATTPPRSHQPRPSALRHGIRAGAAPGPPP